MFKKFILIIVGCLMTFNVFGQESGAVFLGGTVDFGYSKFASKFKTENGDWKKNDPNSDSNLNLSIEIGYMGDNSAIGVSLYVGAKDGQRTGFAVTLFEEWYYKICENFYYTPRVDAGYLNLLTFDETYMNGPILNISVCGFMYRISNTFMIRTDVLNGYGYLLDKDDISITSYGFNLTPSVTFRWAF